MISKVVYIYIYIHIIFFKRDIVPSAISFSEKKFHPPGSSKESEGEGATPGGLVLLERHIVEIPGYHVFSYSIGNTIRQKWIWNIFHSWKLQGMTKMSDDSTLNNVLKSTLEKNDDAYIRKVAIRIPAWPCVQMCYSHRAQFHRSYVESFQWFQIWFFLSLVGLVSVESFQCLVG